MMKVPASSGPAGRVLAINPSGPSSHRWPTPPRTPRGLTCRPCIVAWLLAGGGNAIIAVAHSMVVSAFHRLSRHEPYRELGANYFDAQRRHYLVDRLTWRIERLGYRVRLEPIPIEEMKIRAPRFR